LHEVDPPPFTGGPKDGRDPRLAPARDHAQHGGGGGGLAFKQSMILAIDTSSTLCAACLWHDGKELGRSVEDIGKGHAERLMAVIDAAFRQAGKTYADVSQVAVSIGPGSFTGIRVGVSAARGLALALGVPAVGISTLAAIAEAARVDAPQARIIAAIDAKRDELYLADDAAGGTATMLNIGELASCTSGEAPVLAGSGVSLVAAAFRDSGIEPAAIANETATTADIAIYARLAAKGRIANSPPKPLYLRGPDAKPQQGFALPRAQ